MTMSRTRQIPSEPASSSQLELTEEHTNTSSAIPGPATLRLRAADEPAANRPEMNEGTSRRIRWSEDVIDNEGMGKKSSKGNPSLASGLSESVLTYGSVLHLSQKPTYWR